MLKAHFDAVEERLIASSRVPRNAGHMIHRGAPREAFIREFLESHLSARLSVGSGEIINAESLPREKRNQFDIVIYKSEYPKIDLGGGISAFLAESVVATIEVKSKITKQELEKSIKSANKVKNLERNLVRLVSSGYIPPGILSFVVSYVGPKNIDTVFQWLNEIEKKENFNRKPIGTTIAERSRTISDSIEGIIILGIGSILFDNSPLSLITDDHRKDHPECIYQILPRTNGNLLSLFLLLTQAVSNLSGEWPSFVPYLKRYPAGEYYFVGDKD